jgi:hypothetical protein
MLVAQQNSGRVDMDYQKFQETYKKEIHNDTNKLIDPVLHPASIPEILQKIPQNSNKKVYALGISDPGMDLDSEVFNLALLRGKMMLSLLYYPEVGIMTDSYIKEQSHSKTSDFATRYANIYKLNSELSFDTNSFKIEAYNVSSFGELVILLSYSIPDSMLNSTISTEAYIYQNERQKQVRFDNEGKFNLSALEKLKDQISHSTSYHVTLLNNTAEIQTMLNQQSLNFQYRNYRYVSDTNPSVESFSGIKLTFGLWKAYAESMIKEICKLSQNSEVEIKQLDDNYNAGKQALSRELLTSQSKFQLSDILIYNNRLSVNLKKQ